MQQPKLYGWLLVVGCVLCGAVTAAQAATPLAIGHRRELFVDRYLVERLEGARLELHEPRDEGVVLRFEQPWEGPFCAYCTVIHDGERYRLYYRGKMKTSSDGTDEVTCYAESTDGKQWQKPKLDIVEVDGSKANNVILSEPSTTHNFSPLLDTRPGTPADQRFKALGGTMIRNGKPGLVAFVSADGIHWRRLAEDPVLVQGALDSQNVAFWSELEQCYVCYLRTFVAGVATSTEWKPTGYRSISRTTSPDFVHWGKIEPMQFTPPQQEHLYTNQTHPYFRAPHIYLSLAARFMAGRQVISAEEAQAIHVNPSYFKDTSDAILQTSRGGNQYERTFLSALVRPGIGPQNWVSRSNYPALNIVQTGPAEMSFYVNQDYAQPTSHLRRYSMRLDGLASVRAPYEGGELITGPIAFDGDRLQLNFATSAAGGIRVEIQDEAGKPISGYTLADAVELIGNEIERSVRWQKGPSVAPLAGRTVRLRIAMKDADLYALQFVASSAK